MAGPNRQGILSLNVPDKGALYASYMPFVKNGGIFVQTDKRFSIGDEVFLLMTLMEDKTRLPVAGRVVWITPPGSQGNRQPGIGIQFNDSGESELVRSKIETALAGMLQADKLTKTM